MSLTGGGDRSELRPLRPDGNIDHELSGHVVVGNHKGDSAGFNIVDPRQGTVHQYGTKRDILAARGRGWWIADPEVDGRPAYDIAVNYGSDRPTPIDTVGTMYPEYAHLVTTEENFRRLMEEHAERSRAQMPSGANFLDGVSRGEFEMGRSERGHLATRFATRDHGTSVMEGNRVLEHLSPRGILREEDL